MLTVILGTDKQARDTAIAETIATYQKEKQTEVVFKDRTVLGTSAILEHVEQQSLFGAKPILIVTDFSVDSESALFWEENIEKIQHGIGIVVAVFETLDKSFAKKLQALNVAIRETKSQAMPSKPKPNTRVFALTDAFLKKDKKATWQIFRELIDRGTEPREIANTLFWSIKTLALVADAVIRNQSSVPGIHPFVFSKTKTVLSLWVVEDIKHALHTLVVRYHEGQFSGGEFDQILEQYFIEMK